MARWLSEDIRSSSINGHLSHSVCPMTKLQRRKTRFLMISKSRSCLPKSKCVTLRTHRGLQCTISRLRVGQVSSWVTAIFQYARLAHTCPGDVIPYCFKLHDGDRRQGCRR